MTHASLFSGIGGPEVAAAMLGWENAFHCEINPFGRAVLEYWFPDSVSYEDITKTDFKPWRGRIDVLTGGFPCQPFSYAGKRGGREDDRYLWPEMLRAIDEIRPTWVCGENVAGITTMVEGGLLADLGGHATLFEEGDQLHGYELEQSFTIERICGDLERVGYSVQPLLIPAAAVGAPHRRDRVFILAHDAGDSNGSGAILPTQREVPAQCEAESGGIREAVCGASSDTYRRYDLREAGADAGESGREGLQERDEVRVAGKSNQIRSEIRGAASDPDGGGCESQDKGGRTPGNRCHDALADKRGFTPEWADGLPAISQDAANPKCARGDKLHEHIQPEIADGVKFVGTCRLRDVIRLIPENRWENFPTISPVHAGNDGLPFRMDGASIPFSRWRTEALKAYGNAIVPQVMYRIFQAIENA